MINPIQKIKVLTAKDWINKYKKFANYIKEELIFPAKQITYREYKTLFVKDINFRSFKRNSPAFYVRSIKNGKCNTLNGYVYTNNNVALAEYSCQPVHPLSFKRQYKLLKPEIIKGKVALLSIEPIHTSYYHWMIESLPRLYLIEKSSFKPDKYIVCNITAFQKQALEMLGISEDRIIETENNKLIQADEVIVSDLINNFEEIYYRDAKYYSKKYFPSWICDFYKEKFVSQVEKTAPQKIYISRKNSYRKVINEEDIIKFLEPKGFKVYYLENMTLKEQVQLFANADIIITPHGAGLTNLIFSPISTKVIEFYSPTYTDVSQRMIAETLNLQYRYILGEPIENNSLAPQFEGIYLDINKLEKTLEDIQNPQNVQSIKKNLAIVLNTCANKAFATANQLREIKKHIQNIELEIIVYIQNLREEDVKLLYDIVPCRFINYIPDKDNSTDKEVAAKVYSSKYKCFDLLNFYEKVLWIDPEINIKNNLTCILSANSNNITIWSANQSDTKNKNKHSDNTNHSKSIKVMLISNGLNNQEELTKWCYEKENSLIKDNNADKDVIHLMLENFNIATNEYILDFNQNSKIRLNENKDFILCNNLKYKDIKSCDNYNNWIKNGGSKYNN